MIGLQTILTYLTLIAVPVGVFYHILTLYNTRKNQQLQLETRQAQLFMQLYNRMDDEFMDSWHELNTTKIESFEDYWEIYDPDKNRDKYRRLMNVLTFFSGIGVLLREGLMDIQPISFIVGAPARHTWEKLMPAVDGVRKHYGSEQVWAQVEFLYLELMKFIEENPQYSDSPPS
jgi:hypothetical protein